LSQIWAKVLSLDLVGIHDSFIELGGHSLKAVQVVARASEVFKVDLPLYQLFETPTIARLADAIQTLHWAKKNASLRDNALTSDEETGEV
jgi:acyl carrier protein